MNKQTKFAAVFLAFGLICVAIYYFYIKQETYSTSQIIMDTIVTVDINGDNANIAGEEIIQRLKEFDSKTSFYYEDSLVSEKNNKAGSDFVSVDEELYNLIKSGYEYSLQSDGIFDITIAPISEKWDITSNVIPTITKEDLALVNYEDMLFNDETLGVMLKNQGQKIDLGAIAKGYACDIVKDILQSHEIEEAIISLGGNIVSVSKDTQKAAIRHPRGEREETIAAFDLNYSTISTAGDYERYFELDGKRYHHILDSNTGMPYESPFMSVSIICDDGALGDYLATRIFLSNEEDAKEILDFYNIDYIVVSKDNKVYTNIDIELRDDSFGVVKWQ